MSDQGSGPLTLWQCPECLTEIEWKTTRSTVDVQIELGCPWCPGKPRIVEMNGIPVGRRFKREDTTDE